MQKASKSINLIARTNGVGLESDVSIVKDILEQDGHEVTVSHCREKSLINRMTSRKHLFDTNIYMERIFPNWIPFAKNNILIPNQERFPKRHINRLKKIDTVLCKTQHATDIFSNIHHSQYVGFTSKNLNRENTLPNYSKFLHLAGRSTLKGTEVLIQLWSRHPEWPTLTLIQHKENAPESVPSNIDLITDYLKEDQLIDIMNQAGIHLCPSLSEGWGHYIAEAMSCAAVVITTDAPPMNELIDSNRGLLVEPYKSEPRHLGTNFYVDPEKLEEAITKVIEMADTQKESLGFNAQQWFAENQTNFKANITHFIQNMQQ